jgi:uncharacterized protein with beta-barrel porin domain
VNRKTLFLGAVSALIALPLALPAMADDLTISTTTTEAVETSAPDPDVVSPGDITITSTGQVNVTDVEVPDDAEFPPAAVTLNSNNDVTNSGTISATAADTPVAVEIEGGYTGTFTNNGIIKVLAGGTNPILSATGVAVLVRDPDGNAGFVGDLVFGANSETTASGSSARAIAILTGVNGDLLLDGTVTALGTSALAIEVDGKITGAITNSAIVTSDPGADSPTAVPVTPGSAIYVHHDVTLGILNTAEGTFGTQGSSPALRISAEDLNDDDNGDDEPDDSTPITIGTYDATYSLLNLGTIQSDGHYPASDSIAMQLGGSSTADTIFTTGFYNGGIVAALATSDNDNATNADESPSNATALIFGSRATLPEIYNDVDGEITATTEGPAGGRAIGIDIAATGSMELLTNHGRIIAFSGTENETLNGLLAYGVRDRSGTLVDVINTGTISAVAQGTNGRGYALDLREAETQVTVTNTGTIVGDIHFGDAVDSIFTVNGATASASGFFESSGNVDISVSDGGVGGTLTTRGVRNADIFSIGDNGVLNIQIAQSLDPIIRTEGVTTLSALSQLHAVPTTFLVEGAYELIEAEGTLTIGNLAGLQATVQSELPYLFGNSTLSESEESLYLNVARLSEDQIGLTGNARRLYDAVSTAALEDNGVGVALLGLNDGAQVQGALEQFVPFDGRASRMVVSGMTDPMVGNVANRQRNLLMQRGSYGQGGAWVEGGYTLFENTSAAGFDGNGGGGAIGVDWGAENAGHFGFAYSFFHGNADSTGAVDRETRMDWNVLTLYLGFDQGPIYVNAQINGGVADVEGKRLVEVGNLTRVSETRGWNEVLGSGAISAGYVFNVGNFRFSPSVGIDYVTISRSDYTETNGGAGVDLKIQNAFEDELRGFAGISFSGGIPLGNVTVLPRGYAGVQHRFMDSSDPITAEFLAVPGVAFRTYNPAMDGTAFIGGVGVDVSMGYWLAGLEYSAMIHPNATVHNFAADASVRF